MINIDGDVVTVTEPDGSERRLSLGTPEAFSLLSELWLRAGWDTKYVYGFSWMGRPIIQLPEDMFRMQEVISALRPDVIIETGIAHGGSLIFYASLCRAMDKGRVIGIDIEIRPHNRAAIEAHPLFPYLTLIEGSSIAPDVVAQVREKVRPDETTLIVLDSKHTRDHVLGELNAYGPLVSVGSYIVATDGIMGQLSGAPRTAEDWSWNNPREAAREFVAHNSAFIIEEPTFPFNEGEIRQRVTYWPDAFIKRVR